MKRHSYREVKKALDSPYVEFLGFPFPYRLAIFEKDPYLQALNVTLKHIKNIKDRYDFDIKEDKHGRWIRVTLYR